MSQEKCLNTSAPAQVLAYTVRPSPSTSSNLVKMEAMKRGGSRGKANGYGDSGPGPLELNDLSSASSPSDLRTSAIHGSMENIHRPKNYRRRGFTPSPMDRKINNQNGSPGKAGGVGPSKAAVLADSTALYKYIEEERQKILVRKAVTTLVCGALKKQSARVVELEAEREAKGQESAARLILHNLLLNSWRTARMELDRLSKENAQLSISVENLGLQLRVVRHLQATEKDRASEKANEIRVLKSQLAHIQQAHKNAQGELKSLEEELRFAREDNEKLVAQRAHLKKELETTWDQKEGIMRAMELEKRRANRAEDEVQSMKLQVLDLKKQVRELTSQSASWQERARDFESRSWEMKLSLETREQALVAMNEELQGLLSERDDLKIKKEALHAAYNDVNEQLALSLEENNALKADLSGASTDLEVYTRKTAALEDALKNLKLENRGIQSELYDFKLKKLRSRRAWLSTLAHVTRPSKWFTYLFYGPEPEPERIHYYIYKPKDVAEAENV